ncbi:ABC transporter permease [Paenibacillus spiritus]|uniref:ABC transporter permease n=1 Tax=Paenibacillus spiritus TaxID=2496557 RepID=A0A5J5FZT8_9BACL|nr:ABC transporter permease [Paenibacillus spiritus]KAA8998821.1 ABC transporter permease [Paenibacillus spiritus]
MWTIFITSMKRKVKNPVVIVNYILLPLLLIVILGNALSGVFDSKDEPETKSSAADRVKTVVVNEDKGQAGQQIVAFLKGEANRSLLEVQTGTNDAAAKQLLKDGKAEQYIHIPAGLSQGTAGAEGVTVYGKDSDIEKIKVTELTLSAFSDGYLAMKLSKAENPAAAYTHAYAPLLKDPQQAAAASAPAAGAKAKEASGVSAISYYGVTMLVLILVYGLANTMNFVKEEYSEALGERYLVSPVSRVGLIMGQFLTGCSITVLQGLIIVLCAKWFFQADYGNSLLFVFFIILAGSIFFNALGLLLGVISRRVKQLDGVVTILIPAMTFIGGGFIKMDMGELRELSINEIFQQPLFDYMQQGIVKLMPVYGALGYAFVFMAVSVFLLSRKGVR